MNVGGFRVVGLRVFLGKGEDWFCLIPALNCVGLAVVGARVPEPQID